jgi:DNA polymerase-1
MANPERLFLLDGMALAYRSYFAFISRPLINSKGQNTSAIYGFTTALLKILEDETPEHIAVVFDTAEPTFRHKKFKEYKATRQKMPEDMASQLDKLKEVVRAFRAPLLELPGYEADDIIGTLARRAEKENVETFMVTPDKDFMQLISPTIKMYKPGKSGSEVEIVDVSGVEKKFGVAPHQVIDVLALIGDKSDNIPGVPGIGEKTAIPLIQTYGSLEELYNHVNEIPQKGVREKLITHRDKAFLSRELLTIQTDVPIDVDFHELRAAKRDTSYLIRLFGELEFKSLAAKLRETERFEESEGEGEATSFEPPKLASITMSSDEHSYTCVTTEEALVKLCARLSKAERMVIDTETTSNDPMRCDLVGLSISLAQREAYYIPVRYHRGESVETEGLFKDQSIKPVSHNNTGSALSSEVVLKNLKPVLENPAPGKIGQNIKYDMLVLLNHGIALEGIEHDTMVANYVIRADGQHNLDALAQEYLGYKMISFEDLVGKGKSQKHITEVPLEALTDYSAEDADITMRIHQRQLQKLRSMELLELCRQVEFPLIPVLARMEFAGVSLDAGYLAGMSKDLERQLDRLQEDIYSLVGGKFNINSTQQLGDILFNKLKLRTVRRTKTGFSTDVGVLETLRHEHPMIERLLEYRQLIKLKSTYVDALPQLIHPRTGRVHTSFNQTVAATGRLSSSDPNLQNIPIRTEIGRAIRKAFIPGQKNMLIMSADYSQIELRIMAHVSGDKGLVEAFRSREDIHASTAAKVFGVEPDSVTRDMRRKAKEVNFGIMYGIGPFGLASRLEISQTEAKEIINRYFERFPRVQQYIRDTLDGARSRGYVSTLLGRRRYLPDIRSRNQNVRGNAERQAINMPIQGTAADMIKLAMINLDSALRKQKLNSRMVLQVHDELVFEVPENELSTMQELTESKMKGALKLDVPIEIEIGSGKNWLEAH